MTSKNSFWANCRENQKRRIWVWIVAALSQLVVYGGMTMVYLSRIRSYRAEGFYRTEEAFREAMCRAARDALGFSDNVFPITLFLGAIIGMQGFSYLYDRRKVDLYHSVPVTKDRRFAVVYLNGFAIWLVSHLLGLLAGLTLAGAQGAVSATVLADMGLAFLWNLLLFLVSYHLMILSVMLTGNRFVTIGMFAVLGVFELCVNAMWNDLCWSFYDTYTMTFSDSAPIASVLYDCTANIWDLKNIGEVGEKAALAFPILGKWTLLAAGFLAAAWFAYRKRASEAAGKAIAFPWVKPVFKLAVAIPGALVIGNIVYDASSRNEMLMALGMLAGTLVLCAAMEVLFAFDIRCVIKHLPSTGIALACALAIFCIFNWDLTGYDSYIPKQNQVESIAISPDSYYDNYWDENRQYMDSADYIRDNMFLTDPAPVLELAKMAQGKDAEEMGQAYGMQVLYRLRSGGEKARRVLVDYDDPETAALLNEIFKTDEFKRGIYQVMTNEKFCDGVTAIRYANGSAKVPVPVEEADALRAAWIRDMEQFDFTLARDAMPCGQIRLEYEDHAQRVWYVYDSFAETIALLQKNEAYYPVKLNAEDIDYITVTNYHNELREEDAEITAGAVSTTVRAGVVSTADGNYTDYTVKETFTDKEQIEDILSSIHPSYLTAPWGNYHSTEENYSVDVVFRKESTYPYERDSYYFDYSFVKGQVPGFVEEATAYTE
ncbi:MAG: DUF6449 domain-containing protein [Bacteroidales bacterium]|nr:DUF6449 domain-containing protein [Bacteroidales bacterium]MCM1415356.1 DUF6449 domain-containing protein [bacterium]MCM1424550.1 DUF6449 domain-containing protein [bacterium]